MDDVPRLGGFLPRRDLARRRAAQDLEPAVVDALFRTDPHSPPIDPYWEELRKVEIGALTPAFRGFTGVLGGAPAQAASNNWVIGGERTASGLPIVANDPHLVQRVPSLWYAADLAGGGLHVAGATIPGVPGVTIGHSERVAWGLTNVMADLVDLVASRPERFIVFCDDLSFDEGEPGYKALFDATSPSTQALGDAAAVGTAIVAARRW